MSVNLEFIDFFSILIIPFLISSIITIVYNIFLIKSGKNQSEIVKFSRYLVYAGCINISFILISFIIPDMSFMGSTNNPEIQMFVIYKIFIGLLFSIPSFFTYGVTFFVFGRKNREHFSTYPMIAGILWIIVYLANIVQLNGELYEILFIAGGISIIYITMINMIFSGIPEFLNIIAFILLIVHGYKNNDKNLKMVGILFLLGIIISIIISFLINAFLIILYPLF